MKEIRTRFAPSPTGFLHVGGARTALYNYLYSKRNNGKFILRIEDTDVERSTKKSEDQLIEALTWFGLDWDEGPKIDGDYGPYRQSERTMIYLEKAQELLEKGLAYESYIYPEEIEKIKNDLLESGQSTHYTNEMMTQFNTKERIAEYVSKGLKPVIFFKMNQKEYVINDLIKGKVVFKEGSIGDFVLIRSNGLPTYNFAVTIDDMMMKITHVIRGDDHLSNTLRQLAIYEAFEEETPEFAHVSMILGADGKRLSKRHGATSVEEFRYNGYLPEAVLNYLALLGWSHPEEKEVMPMEEMVKEFNFNRVNSSAAIFDDVKLKWMNGCYIRNTETERLYNLSIPFIVKAGILSEEQCKNNKKWLLEAIELMKVSIDELTEIPEKLRAFIEDFDLDLQDVELKEFMESKNVLLTIKKSVELFQNDQEWTSKTLLENIKVSMKECSPDKKAFYQALRKIVTNEFHGPDLVKSIHLIGRARTIQRIERVVSA
jgi:nondiscriminating glutamyl-tRNA synthetase